MATAPMNSVIQQLRRTVLARDEAAMTDGQLLDCFVASKDEGAFETLLRRHGPMVLGVCRRVLRNHHDAEDAFQATFLVLARKASSVKPSLMVGNWLHGVAYRTALKANEMSQKRKSREKHGAAIDVAATARNTWDDLQPLIDEELNRLPDRYRLPIVLCDLEGKSIKEATHQLGWPQGTLAGRLARARKLLARRLAQRGIALSGGALAMTLSANGAAAGVQPTLAATTIAAAVAVAKTQTAASMVVSAKAAALMEGVMKAMLLTKLKTFASLVLLLSTLTFGSGLAIHYAAAQQGNAEGNLVQAAPRVVEQPRAVDDRKALEGTWKFRGFERGGDFLTADEIQTLRGEPFVQMVITPDECVWELRPADNEIKVLKFHYAVRTSDGMKWLKLTPRSKKDEPSLICSYSFQGRGGDELKIAFPHKLTNDGRLFAYHYFKRETPDDKKASDKAADEKKLEGEWVYNDEKMGTVSVTFGPNRSIRFISEHQDPDVSQREGFYAVDWSETPHHLDIEWKKGAKTETIFEFDAKGRLRIEAGGGLDDARPKTFTDESIWLTRFDKIADMQADRDLKVAEYYRRTGKLGSAYFYYELTRRRYPGTDIEKKAVQGLEELKKHLIVRPDGSVGFDQGIDLKDQPAPKMISFAPPEAERLLEQGLGKASDVARLSIKVQSPSMFIASNSFVIEKDGRVRMEPFRALQYGSGSQVTMITSDRALISFAKPIEKVADFGNATVVGLQFHGVTDMRTIDIKNQAIPPAKGADAKKVQRVGEIHVVGNQKTPTTEILKLLPIFPGEVLVYQKLRTAEKNLAAFKATVTVIEANSGEFRDILVTIKE